MSCCKCKPSVDQAYQSFPISGSLAKKFQSMFEAFEKSGKSRECNGLLLCKGNSNSRLLKKAKKISAYSQDKSGKKLKVLSPEAQRVFGDFEGKISIQRCPPRWVNDSFVEKAVKYIKSLE